MPETNKELVRRWFQQVWNEKRESAIDELFDSQGKAHGFPDHDSVLEGPAAFKAVHQNFCRAFPDLNVTLDDVLSEGDRVAVRWHAVGTHRGDDLGFPATGTRGTMVGSSFVTVREGRIIDGWNQMDTQGFFQRLKQGG